MNKNVIFSFIILMITAFSVSLASCGSDDDDSVASGSSLLVGTWSIVEDNHWNNVQDSHSFIKFNANGEGEIQCNFISNGFDYHFTYIYSQNKLLVTSEETGEVGSYEVITLNDKELIYQFVEKDGVVSQRRFSRN